MAGKAEPVPTDETLILLEKSSKCCSRGRRASSFNRLMRKCNRAGGACRGRVKRAHAGGAWWGAPGEPELTAFQLT
jgi:hypothetical protein